MTPKDSPKLIVCESLYSMDGDFAPLEAIIDLARHNNAALYVDEVHAVGLYGPQGAGVLAQRGLEQEVTIINGTLAKAVGVAGGYIAGSDTLCDAIRSYAPGYIFTSALPPAIMAAADTSIGLIREDDALRRQHQAIAHTMRHNLLQAGVPVMDTPSHILPVMIGHPQHTKFISDTLLNTYQIYVQPINYPTVPKGTERLRLTPSPHHTKDDIDALVHALSTLWKSCPASPLYRTTAMEKTQALEALHD